MDNETRSLQTVRELLSPERLEMTIKLMCESERCGGMLARMGHQLRHYIDKEKSSTLTTLSRHLRFLDTPLIAENTRTSSFNPADLRNGKMTIYYILPAEHMRSNPGLLRMWLSSTLRAIQAGGIQERNPIHIVCDEAAALGCHFVAIDDGLSFGRGFGLRLHLIYQSAAQPKVCFPNGQDETLLANTTQIYFGVNSNETAEAVSKRIGESTIVVDSGGFSTGGSAQTSQGPSPQTSHGSSHNASRNWQQQARRLIKPEEVMALSPRTAITFPPGMPPVCTTLARYYEEKNLGRRNGWLGRVRLACATLAASIILLATSGILAVALTHELNMKSRSAPSLPVEPSHVRHMQRFR